MKDFSQLASDSTIEKAKASLENNGFTVHIADDKTQAIKIALSLIPEGAEVMTATSKTLTTLGLEKVLNESRKYQSVKSQLEKLNRQTDSVQMQKLGAAPEYMIGSVHAVTEDGKALIASRSGSQLPGYSYGSPHIVWVVSTKKIVKDFDEGVERVYQYVLPQESERVKEAYGLPRSEVRKLLIMNKEEPGRINIILVKEDLGF